METQFRTAYGPKLKVAIEFKDKSRTKQSMKKETDINFIIDKFQKTGIITHENRYQGSYGEFASIDYQEALNTVIAAENMFMDLPSAVRKKFDNNPKLFLDFVTDEKNKDEMMELGLLKDRPVQESKPEVEPEPKPEEKAE